MHASRLLSLLMLLQSRERISAPELARALEVSERTILRDIDHLSAAGVPVWGERGRNGGFQLQSGWSTRLTGLTEPEVSALFLAGLPGPAAELGLGTAAVSARLKVIAGLPPQWRERAQEVAARLHIDPLDWYRAGETAPFLHLLADAVWSARRLRIRYLSWNGAREREADPLGLVLKAGVWYFVAQSPGSRRIVTYRLANVLDAQPSGRRFKRPPAFDLARYWAQSVARFEADLRPLQAQVRVSARGAAWLANERIPSTPLPASDGDADGWTRVVLAIESTEHAARKLLAFGAELEVLEPPELRRAIADAAQGVQAVYARG